MIRLVLDAQNNRIIIEDTENQAQDWKHNPDELLPNQADFDLAKNGALAKLTLNDVDFGGFVLELIDPKGQKWLSEIIGLAVNG